LDDRAGRKSGVCALPLSVGYIIIVKLAESAFSGFMANPTSSYLLKHPETVVYYILMLVFKTAAEWLVKASKRKPRKNPSNPWLCIRTTCSQMWQSGIITFRPRGTQCLSFSSLSFHTY
jgi:hypothetical protein